MTNKVWQEGNTLTAVVQLGGYGNFTATDVIYAIGAWESGVGPHEGFPYRRIANVNFGSTYIQETRFLSSQHMSCLDSRIEQSCRR